MKGATTARPPPDDGFSAGDLRGLGTVAGGWVNACAGAGVEVAVQLVEGQLVLGGSTTTYGAPQRRSYSRARSSPQKSEEGVLFFQCSWSEAIAAGIRVVENWCPDVVHLHTAMLWYVAGGIKATTGKPLVFHVHSVDRAEYDIGNEPNPFSRMVEPKRKRSPDPTGS